MCSPIWEEETVTAELCVVNGLSKVSAIGVKVDALEDLGVLVSDEDGLVNPVPKESTLGAWIVVEEVPILSHVACGVAHRVSVLA